MFPGYLSPANHPILRFLISQQFNKIQKMFNKSKQTFEDRLVASGRRPSGFDYMRLILAIYVVLSHTTNIAYGMDFTLKILDTPLRSINGIILPLFFALSGFLVAGSLERCRTLVSFIGLRFIRLIPALAVETVLAALVIGAIFTTLPLNEYFSSHLLYRYAYNIVGHVQFVLPGVFHENPMPDIVNGQLWTLPFELICYLLISLLVFLNAASHRKLFFISVLSINLLLITYKLFLGTAVITPVVPGMTLVLCFLYGISFYLYRGIIPWSKGLFVISLLITLLLLLPQFRPYGDYFVPFFAAYVTVYIGLSQPRRIKFLLTGDYSYGIFLYGYPVQQAVTATLGESGHHWYINFIVSMPIILLIAAFSWWLVEKPSLKLKKPLIQLEDRFIKFATGKLPGMFPIFIKVHTLEPSLK